MNREEAKELLPLIQAYVDGKEIEFKPKTAPESAWRVSPPDWSASAACYRVKPEKQEAWVNIYGPMTYGGIFGSKKEAISGADPGLIACIRIEYTEGQGL